MSAPRLTVAPPTFVGTVPTNLLPARPTRFQIEALEDAILAHPGHVTELPTGHHFAEGLYGRSLFIPAGTVLTGKAHKAGHLNFLMLGEIEVWTEAGMVTMKAPRIIPSDAGAKRVGRALTDTVWVSVHATDKTTPEEVEADLIEPPRPRAIPTEPKPCLG